MARIVLLCLGLLVFTFIAAAVAPNSTRFAVVVDAGSTGNRAFLFRIHYSGAKSEKVDVLNREMLEPGIADFAANPAEAKSVILPLLTRIAEHIPEDQRSSTTLFVRATGGMRLLSDADQQRVWNALQTGLATDPTTPFPIEPSNFGTIDGKSEAYYAVIAANYVAGRIDGSLRPVQADDAQGRSGPGLIGALDMGGSSTQMIYHTGGEGAQPDDFWSHSWTAFGVSSAREKVWNHIAKTSTALPRDEAAVFVSVDGDVTGSDNELYHNPCAFLGHEEVVQVSHGGAGAAGTGAGVGAGASGAAEGAGPSRSVLFRGAGDPAACMAKIRETLWGHFSEPAATDDSAGAASSDAWKYHQCAADVDYGVVADRSPCPINDVAPQKHLLKDSEFYAMSVYFFAFDCVHNLGPEMLEKWPSPSIAELETAVHNFCSAYDWEYVAENLVGKHSYTTNSQISVRCFESLYLITILKHAFGFDDSYRGINFAPHLDGVAAVEWPLGFLLNHLLPTGEHY